MIDFIKDNSFIIAQAFGFLAMGVGISMYQFNKHRTVMLMMVLCALTWCCHYTFLGLFTPVAMNFLGAVKNFIFSFKEGKQIESKREDGEKSDGEECRADNLVIDGEEHCSAKSDADTCKGC